MGDKSERVSDAAFDAAKRGSISQLLIKAARLCNERGLSWIPVEPGQPRLRPSHTAVFPHLEMEGIRLSTLASRMGISKQAVGQLVGDMEDMGILRRIPDPSDGRAKLVVFAEHGPTLLMRGMQVLMQVDTQLEERLGPRRSTTLRRALETVIDELG